MQENLPNMSTTETTSTPTLHTGTWVAEPAHSEVGFTVRHLGLSKVRGRFNSFTATAEIADPATASSVTASIDMSSVDTNNADRDGHLRSSDFFDAEQSPQMTFVSTNVTEDTLAGNLTINGITKPVELDLEFHGVTVDGYGATRSGFSAEGVIKRSDFGIDFNMPVGMDGMLISDKVQIALEIQLVPQG
jgi:polyisoprenoid-binding protein YceI